jgi:hypothetical protein
MIYQFSAPSKVSSVKENSEYDLFRGRPVSSALAVKTKTLMLTIFKHSPV